jgi:integrase
MPKVRTRVNFTKAAIAAIPPAPAGRRMVYHDTQIRGLQLIVTERGAKSFYFYKRIGGKPYRDLLGTFPHLQPENARNRAKVSAGKAAMGVDLRMEKHTEKRERITLEDAFDAYKIARPNLKTSTLYSYKRFLAAAFEKWQKKALVEITKDMVAAKHRELTKESGPGYADGAMRFLRAVINFAQFQYEAPDGTPLLPDNPVRRISQTRAWNRPKRRTTYVRPDELKPWFEAVLQLKADPEKREAVTVADWLLLMMLTGLRRGEAQRLRWADVDLKGKTLTVRDTKNHEDHTLPLSDYLFELLEARKPKDDDPEASEFVFSSYGRTGYMTDPRELLEKVATASGVKFTPHDLRRTFITVAESLDIRAYALKRLLNHKMASDVTAGYIIADVERLRKPMQQVTDFMLISAGLKPAAKVVPLPTERAS